MNQVPPADDAPNITSAKAAVATPTQRLPDIEHVAAAALGAFMALPELRVAALGAMKDDEIVAEYNRRHIVPTAADLSDDDIKTEYIRRNFVEDEDSLKEKIATQIAERCNFATELLKMLNDYELNTNADKNAIRELCENAEIELQDDGDYSNVIRAAARVAFGSFASWSGDVADLLEEFKRLGITHQSAVD